MTRPIAFLKFPTRELHTFASRTIHYTIQSLQKSARVIQLISTFLLFGFGVQSQNLSLNELFNICKKENWDEVNELLVKKGWEYYESSKGDDEHYNIITWSYDKERYNDKAHGWFYLYTYEGQPNKISYTFFNKQSYNNLKTAINTNGMKLIDSSIADNRIETKYANANFIVSVIISKRLQEDETYGDPNSKTIYSIEVVNKSGVYDKDNGLKKVFDADGNLESEYTLKDGNISGIAKAFHANGQVKVISFFTNGKKQGGSKEYDEHGNLTAEYNYVNGDASGIYKIYENGKIKLLGSLLMGKKNGQFKAYDSDGNIDMEYQMKDDLRDGKYIAYYYEEGKLQFKLNGQYLAGEKVGLWQINKMTTKEIEILDFENFNNGVRNGSFKEVRKDSVIFGYYKNGELHGQYSIYRNMKAWLMGGLYGDTTKSPLVVKGYYDNGLRSGEWEFFSMSKALLKVGQYENDVQTGQWKYYYDNYIDEKGNKLAYSRELYLIENYEDGLLHGTSTRYSYIDKMKVKCDLNLNKDVSPTDSCINSVYRKLVEVANYNSQVLNGLYEFRDSLNNTILRGKYSNGKRDGEWFERYRGDGSGKEELFVYQIGSYKNGDMQGEWRKYFDTKEKPFASYTYEGGLLHGKATMPDEERYFEKGKLKKAICYDSLGNIDGSYELIRQYDKSLICTRSQTIDDQKILDTFSLPPDTDDASIYYSESNLDRPFIFIFTLKATANGSITLFDKTGRILMEGNLNRENKIGIWIWYYYDQDVFIEREFENNEDTTERFKVLSSKSPFSGTFSEKFTEGGFKSQIKVSDGLRNGNSKYFDKNGKVEKTIKYKKGLIQN